MAPAGVPAFLDAPGPLAIAHRGGAASEAENSLAAFAHAVALGYRYVETDVHATADGVLVAFHDATLDRVTDRSGAVAALPWSEVRRARIGGREPVPTFEQILTTWPDLRVVVDPKADAAIDPLVALLTRLDAVERVCVGSFSEARLQRVRAALGPRLCTSAGPAEVRRLRLASWGLGSRGSGSWGSGSWGSGSWGLGSRGSGSRGIASRHGRRDTPAVPPPPAGPACLQIPVRHGLVPLADRRLVDEAHARGLPVQVWTVNDPAQMARLLDLGVDGIITDDVAALRRVLVERGQWH